MTPAHLVETSHATDALNRAAVLDRLGGDVGLLREITAIFLAEYPDLLAQIGEAIRQGKARDVERSAHTLKGAVANFGFSSATDAALQLELIGRRGRLAEAPAAFEALLACFDELQPLLTDLLQ